MPSARFVALVTAAAVLAGCPDDTTPGVDLALTPDGPIPDQGSADTASPDASPDAATPDAGPPLSSWAVSISGSLLVWGTDVAVDSAGNSYLVGSFRDKAKCGMHTLTAVGQTMYQDAYVAKLAPDGSCLWAKSAGGVYYDDATGVALDPAGNVYVVGHYEDKATFGTTTLAYGSSYHSNLFVAKLDAKGAWVWARHITALGGAYGSGIAVDSAGNSYVTGSFSGLLNVTPAVLSKGAADVLVARLDKDGKLAWVKTAGGPKSDAGTGVALDGQGGLYVAGQVSGSATFGTAAVTAKGQSDAFVARLTTSGAFSWTSTAGGSADSSLTDEELASDVAAGPAGPVITGRFVGPATFGATTLTAKGTTGLFVAQLDTSGAFTWAKAPATDTASDWAQGNGVAVGKSGAIHVAGEFGGKVTCGAKAHSSKGVYDALFLALDAKGSFTWSEAAGSAGSDYAVAVAVDGAENRYYAGFFNDTITLGGTSLTSKGDSDAFLWKVKAGTK